MASFFSFSTRNYVEIVRGGTRICLQLLSSLKCVRRPSCRTDVDDIIIRICSSRRKKTTSGAMPQQTHVSNFHNDNIFFINQDLQ